MLKNIDFLCSQFTILCKNPLYSVLKYSFRMYNKENESETKPKKSTKATKNKMIESGNDYVFRSYRLEENRHFQHRKIDELGYEVANPKHQQNHEQEGQDELVLVPLELPLKAQEHQLPREEKISFSDMVYVFDDDEADQQSRKKGQISILEEKEQIMIKNQGASLDEITQKGTERGNFSTAELMSPKPIRKRFQPSILSKDENDSELPVFQKRAHFDNASQPTGLQSLQGVKFQSKKQQSGVSITITDKKLFSLCRLPSGIVLRCKIKRTSSFLNILSPEYDLYLANGLKHILSAKKYPMRNRQLFKFSTDPLTFDGPNVLAVMHANANHNIYWLLDLPKKINQLDISLLHLIIGYCRLKKVGHRKFTALLPETKDEFRLAIDYEQAFINFSNFREEISVHLNNLQQWEGQSENSTKNFVLADEDDPEYRYLELKKESDNMFELTVQHPLSPLQAMAIAMTRFDAQLN